MPDVILGRDIQKNLIVSISDVERRSGLYILGRMGRGKTSLMTKLMEQDMTNGHGVFFLDPHGDAVEDLLQRIPSDRQNDVIVLDPRDSEYAFGMNLLACSDITSWAAREDTFDQAIDIFTKLFADPQTGILAPWLGKFLRNCFYPLLTNQGYTIAEIPLFLKDKPFRDQLLRHPVIAQHYKGVVDFWQTEFAGLSPRDQRNEIESTLTRLDSFTRPYIKHIVGQSTTTLSFSAIMNMDKILFVKLPKTLGDAWRIIGTMLVSNLVHAVRQREQLPAEERHQFCIFVDEFQNFASSDDFAVLFTEARKYGIATTIAHQERYGQFADNKRIAGATDAAVIKLFFQPTPHDAEEQAVEFAARATPTETHREAELVISPHPIEDIWERGYSEDEVMEVRNKYFWIVDLLKRNPHEKYFQYQGQNIEDTSCYRSSADMLREGVILLNEYLFQIQTQNNIFLEDIQVVIYKVISRWGGLFGFLPTMEYFVPDEKRTRLLQLRNEKFRRDYEQEKRDYEQKRRDLIQERRDKIQIARDQLQYEKEHTIEAGLERLSRQYPSQPDRYRIETPEKRRRTEAGYDWLRKQVSAQDRRQDDLWKQLQALEQNPIPQPPFPVLHSIDSLPQKIDDIHAVAIQAGMTFHEVENLIEWRVKPLGAKEKFGLGMFLLFYLKEAVLWEADEQSLEAKVKSVNDLAKTYVFGDSKYATWQVSELQNFCTAMLLLVFHLREKPIRIPSGHYDESLRVERTQQDLNNDMVQELLGLQPHTAFVKSGAWKGKIHTVVVDKAAAALLRSGGHEFVDVRMIARARTLNAQILRKRTEIEEEIRERQEKWRQGDPGGLPPPKNTGGNSPPSLPSAPTAEDDGPPPISYLPEEEGEAPPVSSIPSTLSEEEPPESENTARPYGNIVDFTAYRQQRSKHVITSSMQASEANAYEPMPSHLSPAPKPQPRQIGGLEFRSLKFYESGKGLPPREERRYSTHFPQRTTCFINFELNMYNLNWQREQVYNVTYRYYPSGGQPEEGYQHEFIVESDSVTCWFSRGCGWPDPGHWTPGICRVVILIDGVKFAEESFTITADTKSLHTRFIHSMPLRH